MERYMNKPMPPDADSYSVTETKGNGTWVSCPKCGRVQFKINEDTHIENLIFQCKNTKCKFNMIVMV